MAPYLSHHLMVTGGRETPRIQDEVIISLIFIFFTSLPLFVIYAMTRMPSLLIIAN